jgi:hypothetical protein
MYKSDSSAAEGTKKGSTKKKSPSHRDPGLLWIVTPSEGVLLGCLSTFVFYVSSDASGN